MCQQHDQELTDGGSLKIFFDDGLCSDSIVCQSVISIRGGGLCFMSSLQSISNLQTALYLEYSDTTTIYIEDKYVNPQTAVDLEHTALTALYSED